MIQLYKYHTYGMGNIVDKGTESIRARGLEVCYKIVSLNNVRRYTHNVLPARLAKSKLNKDNNRHVSMD